MAAYVRIPAVGASASAAKSKRSNGTSPYCVKKPSRIGVKTTPVITALFRLNRAKIEH
jgi:hypothetical protein